MKFEVGQRVEVLYRSEWRPGSVYDDSAESWVLVSLDVPPPDAKVGVRYLVPARTRTSEIRPLAAPDPFPVGTRVEANSGVDGSIAYSPGNVVEHSHDGAYIRVKYDSGPTYWALRERVRLAPVALTWEEAKKAIEEACKEAGRIVYELRDNAVFGPVRHGPTRYFACVVEKNANGCLNAPSPAALVAAVKAKLGEKADAAAEERTREALANHAHRVSAPASLPPRRAPLDPADYCTTCGERVHVVSRQRHTCGPLECDVRQCGWEDGREVLHGDETVWLATGQGRVSYHPLRHMAIAGWRAQCR